MKNFWVKVGSRLHLGHLDLNGSLGRYYGGIGLAINQPQLEVFVKKQDELTLVSKYSDKRVKRIAQKYLDFYELPGAKIEILQIIPSHSGLGSGTQLALALGLAITRVYGLHPSLAELARVTDREGSRSGIGVAAFEHGGVLVDGGIKVNNEGIQDNLPLPPLLVRIPFPEEWAVVLALPYGKEKMFGEKEVEAFKSLQPMDEQVSGKICRYLLMKLLPSLKEKDIESFGQAVTGIQKLIGNYFAPVQGGTFASNQGLRLAKHMLSQGAVGVGQSSWGPVVYGFIRKTQKAKLLESTREFMGKHGRVWGASGVNHGADWGWNVNVNSSK